MELPAATPEENESHGQARTGSLQAYHQNGDTRSGPEILVSVKNAGVEPVH
jgi:hypothetical protein